MSVPGLAQSAKQIISGAMRKVRILGAGESPTADQAQDALEDLNQMLDGWQNDRLSIFTIKIQDFVFTPSKQTYTMGINGDFNTDRPARIERCSLILTTTPSNPLELSMQYTQDESEWQAMLLKATQSTWPLMCYDSGDFPLRSLNFWPVPRDTNSWRCYSWSALQQFSDLTTAYSFPPRYQEAIRYNLAVRLAEEYGQSAGPVTVQMAMQSLAKIRDFNVSPKKLKCDDAVCENRISASKARQEWFGIP